MYTVPGNCTPFGWQTTKESPGWTWQAGGGSFLLLPRRHALSSRWLWTFNHNTCENHLEEVQGSATSSLFTPPLFQDKWPCVQLLCAERNATRQWDLAIDKAKPPASAAKWQGNDQIDLQCQAARHCHHQVQWATCSAGHWGSGPHSDRWSGGAKVLCILHHWGVQLILAYSWARPAILVVGKGRGGMFLFLLFLHFHSCSSFFPVPLFHLLYSLFYLFSPFLWETTQNDPQGLTCR